jgi:hypothetical protein
LRIDPNQRILLSDIMTHPWMNALLPSHTSGCLEVCPRCRENTPKGACACSLPLPPPPAPAGRYLAHQPSVDSAYASSSSTTSTSSISGQGGGGGSSLWAPTASPVHPPRMTGAARTRSRSRPPKSAPQHSSATVNAFRIVVQGEASDRLSQQQQQQPQEGLNVSSKNA